MNMDHGVKLSILDNFGYSLYLFLEFFVLGHAGRKPRDQRAHRGNIPAKT